jgi:hypothetical protein
VPVCDPTALGRSALHTISSLPGDLSSSRASSKRHFAVANLLSPHLTSPTARLLSRLLAASQTAPGHGYSTRGVSMASRRPQAMALTATDRARRGMSVRPHWTSGYWTPCWTTLSWTPSRPGAKLPRPARGSRSLRVVITGVATTSSESVTTMMSMTCTCCELRLKAAASLGP